MIIQKEAELQFRMKWPFCLPQKNARRNRHEGLKPQANARSRSLGNSELREEAAPLLGGAHCSTATHCECSKVYYGQIKVALLARSLLGATLKLELGDEDAVHVI